MFELKEFSPSSTASTSAPIEVSPAAASASPVSAGGGYEGGEDETPAQEIARVPDNNNLYEKIAEIPSTPSTTVSTTAATVPYEAPAPQTSAPYQPPAPRAQIPTSTASSGYDIINEVEAPEKTSEPYGGQKVEAAHITEETGSDYDETENNGNTQQTSHSSSQTYSKTSSTSDGYDQTSSQSSKQQSVVPSAQPYRPQTSNTNNYQQIGSFRQAGNGYNAGGSSYTQAVTHSHKVSCHLLQFLMFNPQPSFVPQPSSYVQSGSYSQQSSSNGCCGGSWFSSQGSLCAPVNYNPCQSSSSSYSSGGCGQQSFGGCGQQSFGSGCGSSCACSSAPTCTPCTPVSSGCASSCAPACTPSCPPPAQQCCCQQPAANPFASLCGGRKKRSIQTLLGICGRRRRL
ncbi:hypothetical protein M3Y97_00922400 [Aphelenchoides bicaudatus]|nr:hypothetical protein M3Y97_00922400 [Aphelenchoides bicaudatus]